MSGTALKRLLSRAQMRLADRSDACEGPGWARTEHMQQESGYVGGVPKMAAGAEAFLEDAGCWQASLPNARELLEAAGARERARVGGSGRGCDPRARLLHCALRGERAASSRRGCLHLVFHKEPQLLCDLRVTVCPVARQHSKSQKNYMWHTKDGDKQLPRR